MSEYEEHASRLDALNDVGNKCSGGDGRSQSPSRRQNAAARKYLG